MKKLSVVVPIYNAEATLRKCVDSILAQQYPELEIVLVDDGSTDASLRICKEYAELDSRVVVYHKENEGLVATRKIGVSLATGEYIGFVDSDDYVDADMYATLMSEATTKDADIVIGGIIFEYSSRFVTKFNKVPAGYYTKEEIETSVFPEMLIPTGFYQFGIIPGVVIKVFKKEILEKALSSVPNGLTIGEDVAITSYSLVYANSVVIMECATYHYVQTETSMIRGYDERRFDAICALYDCLLNVPQMAYQKQVGAYFACLLYGVIFECVKKSALTKKEKKKKIKEYLKNDLALRAFCSLDVSRYGAVDKVKIALMKYKMVSAIIFLAGR